MSDEFKQQPDWSDGCTDPSAFCDVCRGEVYPGELVHVIHGFIICAECFTDYAFDYFSDCLTLGSDIH